MLISACQVRQNAIGNAATPYSTLPYGTVPYAVLHTYIGTSLGAAQLLVLAVAVHTSREPFACTPPSRDINQMA